MDPSAGLCHRYPLHTMHTGFIFKPRKGALAIHGEHNLLHTTEAGLIDRHKLCLITPPLRIAHIHPVKLTGKKGSLLAASPATNLHDDISVIIFILRKQQNLKLLRKCRLILLRRRKLLLRKRRHLRILFAVKKLERFLLSIYSCPIFPIAVHHRLKLPLFLQEPEIFLRIIHNIRLCHRPLDLLILLLDILKPVKHIHFTAPP